jgi:hypothetical protein
LFLFSAAYAAGHHGELFAISVVIFSAAYAAGHNEE